MTEIALTEKERKKQELAGIDSFEQLSEDKARIYSKTIRDRATLTNVLHEFYFQKGLKVYSGGNMTLKEAILCVTFKPEKTEKYWIKEDRFLNLVSFIPIFIPFKSRSRSFVLQRERGNYTAPEDKPNYLFQELNAIFNPSPAN